MEDAFLDNRIPNHFKGYKARLGPDGLHLFNRMTGTNILFDEVVIPNKLWSKTPRQISIALTNTCDLSCSHCYAPKNKAALDFDCLLNWISELDKGGCIGIGLGGGEPTLYPNFKDLCEFVTKETNLALTMTTHGYWENTKTIETISNNLNFIRVSMDGVNSTHETIRGRSFVEFIEKVKTLSKVVPLGINFVVNQATVGDLTEGAQWAEELGATEFLLLPEMEVGRGLKIDPNTKSKMQEWIYKYKGKLRLAISTNHMDGYQFVSLLKRNLD